MECPACHKIQTESEEECPYCGVIFAKWLAKNRPALESTFKPDLPTPSVPVVPATPAKPLLEVTMEDAMAYRVDSLVRTAFGLILFLVGPVILGIHRALGGFIHFSEYLTLSVVCVSSGVLAGMLARKRGYSGVLTAGGAGVMAGVLAFFFLYFMADGKFSAKLKTCLPPFALYSFCTLAGGWTSWVLRKFFSIEL